MSSLDPLKLRAARKAAGLTQAQLAEKAGAGLTRYVVSALEQGRAVDVSLAEQQALAQVLGRAVQELAKAREVATAPALTLNPARLKLARKAAGLTQPQLAAKAGFGQSTISRLETGDTGISLEGVQHLATALGVAVKYLLGETEETPAAGGDPLALIRERYDMPPGLRELAAAEKLLEELKIKPEEWRVLAGLATQWRDASLTPRDGWVQILLALRTASTRRAADGLAGKVQRG